MKPGDFLPKAIVKLESPGCPIVEKQEGWCYPKSESEDSCFDCIHYSVCKIIKDLDDAAMRHPEANFDPALHLPKCCPFFTKNES